MVALCKPPLSLPLIIIRPIPLMIYLKIVQNNLHNILFPLDIQTQSGCTQDHNQLEGEPRRLPSEVAEVMDATDSQSIKMEQNEKRVDIWRDAAHAVGHKKKDAIEMNTC